MTSILPRCEWIGAFRQTIDERSTTNFVMGKIMKRTLLTSTIALAFGLAGQAAQAEEQVDAFHVDSTAVAVAVDGSTANSESNNTNTVTATSTLTGTVSGDTASDTGDIIKVNVGLFDTSNSIGNVGQSAAGILMANQNSGTSSLVQQSVNVQSNLSPGR